jgi:hypothetical protein
MLNGKVIVLGSKGNVAESMRDENKRLESFVTMRANARNNMSYDGDAWQERRTTPFGKVHFYHVFAFQNYSHSRCHTQ